MKNLHEALFKAKAELKNPPKDGKGQFGPCPQLDSVLETTEPVLRKHGLMFQEFIGTAQQLNSPGLVICLVHIDSGEEVRSFIPFTPDCTNPQKIGAFLTYMAKVTRIRMLGLASEGDPDLQGSQISHNRPQARSEYRGASNGPRPPMNQRQEYEQRVNQGSGGRPEDELIDFGKYKGRKYGTIPLEDLLAYLDWLENNAQQQGKPLGKAAERFREIVYSLQESADSPPVDRFSQAPEIPF